MDGAGAPPLTIETTMLAEVSTYAYTEEKMKRKKKKKTKESRGRRAGGDSREKNGESTDISL